MRSCSTSPRSANVIKLRIFLLLLLVILPSPPETTTGWAKGISYTGHYRASEQIITFINKYEGVGGPIVAISSNSIRNNFIGDEGNINTTAEQYLAYTMLHGLGHGAGIGNSHINNRWNNFYIPSIMMGGLGSLNTPALARLKPSE